ncbi:MAG: shikimate dehydrogenase family protein, partial [Candidatus Promineifilaceae bacterium]
AKEVEVNGRHCLVLGAGGSARGIVYALFQAGGRVLLLARRPEQAHQLAADLGNGFVEEIRSLAELESTAAQTKAPLIINTTPLGMSPHVNGSPWPDDVPVPAGSFVYDLVYNPPETRLMRQALDAGCHACNGLGMLLRQGAISFALWTGSDPDLSVMQEALEAAGA